MVQIFVRLLLLAVILFVLYIYMIMPRIFGRPDQSAFRGALFAHRGFFDTGKGIPENSMPAFRRAVAAGYCIELDVQLSKDGIPVVFHDFTLKRMTGRPGRVCDYTAEELSGFYLDSTSHTIPLFSDVLDLVHGETPLLVEIKSEGTNMEVCRKADALLRSYQGTYCIESFNPLVLLWYRRHHPQILRGQLSDRFLAQPQYRKVRLVLPCLALQNMMLDFRGNIRNISSTDRVPFQADPVTSCSLCQDPFLKQSCGEFTGIRNTCISLFDCVQQDQAGQR